MNLRANEHLKPNGSIVYKPRLKKKYGGYNTFIRELENVLSYVSLDSCFLVTWSSYWWNLLFLKNIKYSVFVHGKEIGYRDSYLVRAMQLKVYKEAEKIICVSNYTLRELLRHYPSLSSKAIFVHNGISSYSFSISRKRSRSIKVLSIGQWIERKGFDLLIDAISHLHRSIDISLTIITDQAAPNVDLNYVRILRDVDDLVKRQILIESDIFVLANRHIGHDYEGFGYVLLEAMQASLPCVVGKNGGPSEIIRDGIDGFVVDVESSGELNYAIERLSSNSVLRENMGRTAQERVETTFSMSTYSSNLFRSMAP